MSALEKKRILFVHYSQSGQLKRVVDAVATPLLSDPALDVVFAPLEPDPPFPFPWPFLTFFDTFPETVHQTPRPIRPLRLDAGPFDLVVLAYQAWFLAPSQPMSAFLQAPQAAALLAGKPVITLIACRNMWLMAQERMKERLSAIGAVLIDNAVLTDRAHSAATFLSTPLWMFTGRRGPFLGGLVPPAGVDAEDIAGAARFGRAIQAGIRDLDPRHPRSLLAGLGAVKVNERLIAAERIGDRSFRFWGRLLLALGGPGSFPRRIGLCIYIVFLALIIVTVAPLSALVAMVGARLRRRRMAALRAYFAAPSGETLDPEKLAAHA